MKSKYFLLLVSFVMPLWMWAQDTQRATAEVPLDKTGKIRYKEVVEQEGTPTELFKLCVKWINTAYANPTAVTKKRDMADKKIVIKHLFPIYDGEHTNANKTGHVLYTMTIQFREGRYKVEITDFLLKQVSRFPANRWLKEGSADYHPEYIAQLHTFATDMINDLKKGMLPKAEYQEEEW